VARKKRPQNSYDAQFSVHYLMAAAFLRDGFGLAELEDDAFRDPAILALCDKTTFEPDHESAYPVHYSGAVTVQTTDGRVLSHREQINRGSPLNPMSDDEIKGKYYDNATRTLSLRGATELLDVILGLDQQPDLKRFAALLSPA
jgi:2-methylcitrate dehydratase PrpD